MQIAFQAAAGAPGESRENIGIVPRSANLFEQKVETFNLSIFPHVVRWTLKRKPPLTPSATEY